jgi:AraC family transcriptional regulator of adaptative response/methylated-DNA-[protein]-cysteine methyltransferase
MDPNDSPHEAALDYARIEQAISYLEEHFLEQPDLAALARQAHLSEFHFQRLFSRWAGISPKRFLQFLTVEHAKGQLAASRAVLDAALDSGLSGPGRLHDLFVSMEAVTPGEFKTAGAGLNIRWGVHPTRFGSCLLAAAERGICGLIFLQPDEQEAALADVKHRWRGAAISENAAFTTPLAARIFAGLGKDDPSRALNLLVSGTNFQIKVWEALLRIPPGAVISYQTLARNVGHPGACRAVGTAVGANPIACLIPCHRVIRETGALGGYRWGTRRKRAMLAWESAAQEDPDRPVQTFTGTAAVRSAGR